MKKFLVALLSVFCVFMVSGCDNMSEQQTKEEQPSEFITINISIREKIFIHKKTKVMYLIVERNGGSGITVMLDENGKPLLWEGETNEN